MVTQIKVKHQRPKQTTFPHYEKLSTDRGVSDTSLGKSIDAYNKTLLTKHGQQLTNTLGGGERLGFNNN